MADALVEVVVKLERLQEYVSGANDACSNEVMSAVINNIYKNIDECISKLRVMNASGNKGQNYMSHRGIEANIDFDRSKD